MLSGIFEEPLETFQQLVDNNITLFQQPLDFGNRQFLKESTIAEYNKLEETYHIPVSYEEYNYMVDQYVMIDGTHAELYHHWDSMYLKEHHSGRYIRSKERLRGHQPFGGYLLNKKWHLNEVGE